MRIGSLVFWRFRKRMPLNVVQSVRNLPE